MDDIGRREFLIGGGIIGAGLGLGTLSTNFLGEKFIRGLNRDAVEARTQKLRERVLRSEDYLSDIDLPIPEEIEKYGYEVGKRSRDPKVTDKGVRVTENFYLSSYDGDILEGEVDGYSYTYHYLEGADTQRSSEDVEEMLDITGDGYRDVLLSGDQESRDLGRITDELGRFAEIRPFTRVEDQRPFLTEDSIQELETLKAEAEESIQEYTEFLNSYEGSPFRLYESSTNLIQQLENVETVTYRRAPVLGPVTGRDSIYQRLSVEERDQLLEGKELYEDIGLRQTQERAEQLILDASLRAGKAMIVQKLIEDTIKHVEQNDLVYETPEETEENREAVEDYTDILDEESEEVVEIYFSDAEFELGNIEKEEVYIYEDDHSFELRIKDYDVPLRLNRENSFNPEEAENLADYGDEVGKVFEQIL